MSENPPTALGRLRRWIRDRLRPGAASTSAVDDRNQALNDRLLDMLSEDTPQTRAASAAINEYTREIMRGGRPVDQRAALDVTPSTLEEFMNPALGEPHLDPPRPAWERCTCCDGFLCNIHDCHTHDCACPPIDEWGDIDPYAPGSLLELIDRATGMDQHSAGPTGAAGEEEFDNDGEIITIGDPRGEPGPAGPVVDEALIARLTDSIVARMQPYNGGVIDGDAQGRARLRVIQELQTVLADMGVPIPQEMLVPPRPTGIAGENPRTVTVVEGRTIPWTESTAPVLRWYQDNRIANHVDYWRNRTTTGNLGESRHWVPAFWYTLLFTEDAPDYRAFMNYGLRNVFNDLILEMDEDVLFGLQVIMRARVATWHARRVPGGGGTGFNWQTLQHAELFLGLLNRVFGDIPTRPAAAADALAALDASEALWEAESEQFDSRRYRAPSRPLPTVRDLPPIIPIGEGRNHRAIDT